MSTNISLKESYIDVNNLWAFKMLSEELFSIIVNALRQNYKSIVFVCIGTDRATGDSLGPLIGYKLQNMKYKNIFIHGTLDEPVHAKNLNNVINNIYGNYNKPFIIAIDASLGRIDRIGLLVIGEGSIKPGAGVDKELPSVGDAYITGIVNMKGFMDFMVLQSTRLNLVMKMANTISTGIKFALWKAYSEKII